MVSKGIDLIIAMPSN